MGVGFVPVAVGGEGGCEVDAERGLGADEGWVETVERIGEDCDRVRVPESNERMAAPAGKVHEVERDVGPFVGSAPRQELGGSVEGVQTGGAVAVGGEGFAVSGGQPGS